MELRQALEECTLALLRRIAECRGVPAEESALRAELIQSIHERLLEPADHATVQRELTAAQMDVLSYLRERGWMAKALLLDRHYPRTPASSRVASGGDQPPTISLLRCGLMFRGFATIGTWRGEVYYVPDELQQTMAASLPPSSSPRWTEVAATASPTLEEQTDLHRDLFFLLSFLRRHDRKLSAGTLAESELAKLEREVGGSPTADPSRARRWHFLLHLCRGGGWVRRQGRVLKPAPRAIRLLEGGPEGARRKLLEAYLSDEAWSDLAAIGRFSQPIGGRRIRERNSRRLLLNYLDELVGERWSDEDAFVRAVQEADPEILREDFASLSWGVIDVSSGVELQGPESWNAVEREWVRFLLRGPLSWIEAVRWGLGDKGERCAFKRGSTDYGMQGPIAESGLSVDERLNVVAGRGADLALLFRLEAYLDLSRRGPTSTYRLSRESVLAGLEGGGSWEELSTILQSICPAHQAPKLLATVQEWVQDYGRYVLEAALLLTSATTEDADIVRTSEELRACLHARLNYRTFRVKPERTWELLAKLRQAGHTPRVVRGASHFGASRALEDAGLVETCLRALHLAEALHPGLVSGAAKVIERLEAAIDPDGVGEARRWAEDAGRGQQP